MLQGSRSLGLCPLGKIGRIVFKPKLRDHVKTRRREIRLLYGLFADWSAIDPQNKAMKAVESHLVSAPITTFFEKLWYVT